MLLKPFRILYELLAFGIQAAFIYGLALIASITFLIYMIADLREPTNVKEYVEVPKTQVVEKLEKIPESVTAKTPEKELVCERIEGCETFPNGSTPEEYCPTCVWK